MQILLSLSLAHDISCQRDVFILPTIAAVATSTSMGRAKGYQDPSVAVYRDEPDRDDAASTSSAVPLRDHVPLDVEVPPAYSDDPTEDRGRTRRDSLERLPDEVITSYQKHWHQDVKGSKSTVLSSLLTPDPKALRDYMLLQSSAQPVPLVRMTGTHTETRRNDKKEEKVKVTDFDITISLSGLLKSRKTTIVENGKKAYRGGRTTDCRPRLQGRHRSISHSTSAGGMVPSLLRL